MNGPQPPSAEVDLARLGWNEHIGNHNSLMLPDEAEPRFLINPRGYLFQELRASDLIVCDL